MNSILTTVKRLLGIEEEYTVFDEELIVYINSAIHALTQLGVGNQDGFSIHSDLETWDDFLGEDHPKLESVKTYISLKVRLVFDPPASSGAMEAMNMMIKEYEWRIYETIDAKGGDT